MSTTSYKKILFKLALLIVFIARDDFKMQFEEDQEYYPGQISMLRISDLGEDTTGR